LGDSILACPGALDNLLAWYESPCKNFLSQACRNTLFQQAAWLACIFLRIHVHEFG
jgi:hypothetical protein